MEDQAWEVIQRRYDQDDISSRKKRLQPGVVEDLDRFLLEKLLLLYVREGEYDQCITALQFGIEHHVAVKATILLRVLKEMLKTELNPQIQITPEKRSDCFSNLYDYIQSIATHCSYNISLPYKLWHALTVKDDQAITAYLEKYKASYPLEFLQSYLIDYLILYVVATTRVKSNE